MSQLQTTHSVADYIIGLYEQYGSEDYIGEPVSQLEHMCQSAMLAEAEGSSEEVILAAFFHDLGHFCEHIIDVNTMDGYGVVDHEKLGADFLRSKGFSETIAGLVENHVQAKRYLTWRHPEYYNNLSEASRKTLYFQGGRMAAEEAADFEANPMFDVYIRLRQWDEQAKEPDMALPSLRHYREMIIRHLQHKQV